MKKILGFVVVALSTIILVGCGGNVRTLKCSGSADSNLYFDEGLNIKFDYELDFKKNKLSNGKIIVTLEKDDRYKEDFNSLFENIEKGYKKDFIGDNIDINSEKKNDNMYVITIKLDYSKMSDKEIEKYGFTSDNKETYSNVKLNLKSQGFNCK